MATTKTTHVLLITDMSGSMGPLAADVRGGFNGYLDGLAAQSDVRYRVTATLFDTEFISLCVDVPLDQAPRLTEKNYTPRGMTALWDAVGKTLAEFATRHGKVKKSERVLVVIQTDGANNSSREYTADQVRAMIAEREKTERWGFMYLGAGVAAWSGGMALGLRSSQIIATRQDPFGTRAVYDGLATATRSYAGGQSVAGATASLAATPGVVDQSAPAPWNTAAAAPSIGVVPPPDPTVTIGSVPPVVPLDTTGAQSVTTPRRRRRPGA